MYGVFFVSGFVDNVYWVFTLRRTLHPFVYCFNVQLIYRFRSLGQKKKKQKTGKQKIKTAHVRPRDTIATSWLNIRATVYG